MSISHLAKYANIYALIFSGFFAVAGARGLFGAERRSNGRGGGLWTAPASWQGNALPTMNDAVTILADDTIEFNGNYPEAPACLQLTVQARGVLKFRADSGCYILTVAGPVEVYGALLMNGGHSPAGLMELRLVAQKEEKRFIHIYSNAFFNAEGVPGLPDGRCNVVISTGPPQRGQPRKPGKFIADPNARYNFWHTAFSHFGEYHSNGTGGGLWENPETWRDSIVPGSADIAVIAAGDTVLFDGNNTNEAACRKIVVDPEGTLSFITDGAEHVLAVAGPVELYGKILMNAAGSAETSLALRLVAENAEQQKIRLRPGAAFLAYGARNLPENRRNVMIAAGTFAPDRSPPEAALEADTATMLDLHHVHLMDVTISASALDNTGFKPGERLNIIGSRFAGSSRVVLEACDTPAVRENLFAHTGKSVLDVAAIYAARCQLAQIKDNKITGLYRCGIQTREDVDSSAVGNIISGPDCGIFWQGRNAMIKKNNLEECRTGIYLDGVTGALEDMALKRAATALDLRKSNVQLTNFNLDELPTNGVALKVEDSTVLLLNCNIAVEQVKPAGSPSAVQLMEYLVVKVNGQRPPGTLVQVITAADSGGPPARGADLNVRNSPAVLSAEGLTPLPFTLRPLIVRAWKIERDGKKITAPFYDLIVSAPATEMGKPPTVLKKEIIEPKNTWFRPEPDRAQATWEVTLP